jgi:hypothetical protein
MREQAANGRFVVLPTERDIRSRIELPVSDGKMKLQYMPPLLHPTDRDNCPCGGKKRWLRCHGADPRVPPVTDDPSIDPTLLALGMNVLAVLKEAIESVVIDRTNLEAKMRQTCLLYFTKKMYRVTLAGLTLLRVGQSSQAFTLKRDQYFAWIAFHYYLEHARESILFVAAGALRQRDGLRKLMEMDHGAGVSEKRKALLRDLEQLADSLYKQFSDLKVPKGRSSEAKTPVLIDWKEPDEYKMMEAIVGNWPEEMVSAGESVPDELEDWKKRELQSSQFFHSTVPSQDKHATPMGLVAELSDEEDVNTAVKIGQHEPNGLLYIYLWYPLGVAIKMAEFSGGKGFKDKFTKVRKALEVYRAYFEAQ